MIIEKGGQLCLRSMMIRSTAPLTSLCGRPIMIMEGTAKATNPRCVPSCAHRHTTLQWMSHKTGGGSSGSSGSSSSKKRRRKFLASSSSSANSIVTTRDRIRLLVDTNRVAPRYKSVRDAGTELLHVAQGRVSWLRNKLFTHWNPDYKEGDSATAASGFAAVVGQQQQHMRKFKHGAIMDDRWWMWNIAFALLPAASIAAYCELRGKHIMYDFHRRQELLQLKAVMMGDGDDDDNWSEERGRAILDARDAAAREPELHEQIIQFVSELYALAILQWQKLQSPSGDDEVEGNHKTGNETVPRVVEATKAPEPQTPPVLPKRPQSVAVPPLLQDHDSPSIQELLQRIQLLEDSLYNQQIAVVETDEDKDRRWQQLTQRMKQKSGVRNRVEEGLLQKFKSHMDLSTTVDPAEKQNKAASSAVGAVVVSDSTEGSGESLISLQDTLRKMIEPLWTGWTPKCKDDDEKDQSQSVSPSIALGGIATQQRTGSTSTFPQNQGSETKSEQEEGERRTKDLANDHNTGETSNAENDKSAAGDHLRPWWKRIWTR